MGTHIHFTLTSESNFAQKEKKMTKIAKAKKSTHSKGKGTKVLRTAGKQPPSIAKTVRENPHQQWEIDEIGPIYLLWGKKRIKTKTGKPTKQYYIKSDEKHLVWVKWKDAFSDKPSVFWSAEVQDHFTTNETKEVIRQKLNDKKIWPFPTSADGKDSGWEERAQIAKKEKYQLWQSSKPSEVGQTWKLINGVDPTTGSSDTSTSETSESEAPEEDEEDDEV